MKFTIIGSLGNVGEPLVRQLAFKGNEITVVSRDSTKKDKIQALGAEAAIGSISDCHFLEHCFNGADGVFTMIPPSNYMDKNINLEKEYSEIALNYADAIKRAKVKKVVHLSSVGAHLNHGNGLLRYHALAEKILNPLSKNSAVTFIRATAFYNNLYNLKGLIKGTGFLGYLLALRYYGLLGMLRGKKGVIISNYGKNDLTAWVSPQDIASAVFEELTNNATDPGIKIRYVASDELTCSQVAHEIGKAIGKPYLKWEIISDKQMKKAYLSLGMNEKVAEEMVEMYAGVHKGIIDEDYFKNNTQSLGRIKIGKFAEEFANEYNKP